MLIGWQITNGWSRAETLRHLRDPHYADYALRFGFEDGVYPTEGGLRYWLTALGQHSTIEETGLVDEEQHIEVAIQRLNHLLAQSVALLVEHGFISPEAWEKALICPDGMIQDAASRMRCSSVRDTCYHSTSPDAPRPCPAQEKGRQGCDCDTTACALACQYATPRDPQARFIWYTGSNQRPDNPNQPTDPDRAKKNRGQARYGYRSLALLLADPARRFSLVLLDDFLSAGQIINVGERFEDDSIRLVRDVPVGTPAWKRLYHRARNAAEGRNSVFERWHLKRLPVYGDPRSRALSFQADVWLNLTTLARLVRETTAATGGT